MQLEAPLFVSIPHSGEIIPPEADWLKSLDEVTLMGDVDRYVDQIYIPHLDKLNIPFITTQWHRYAADLNRVPSDIDCEAVLGNTTASGTHPRGFHWVYNTQSEKILQQPLSVETHQALVKRVYEPFHQQIREMYSQLHAQGYATVFHIDAHSCPSRGTSQHRDPGELRKEIIISDSKGKSCDPQFKDLVISAYEQQGFSIAYNWPYFGGRLTEQYGQPARSQHVIQVELNRGLYMDEKSKRLIPEWVEVSQKVGQALRYIKSQVSNLNIAAP